MINKNKNVNLQITISKDDYKLFESIQEQLSSNLSLNLSKSQTITYLIKSYYSNHSDLMIKQVEKKDHTEELKKYQNLILALKDKLNVSYTELSALTGVYVNSLKKYGNGQRAPSKENKTLLDKAFKKYGIKI